MTTFTHLNSYTVPRWCRLPIQNHFDGMGGCWGISHGLVLAKGRDYCRACGFYRRNIGRCDPIMPRTPRIVAMLKGGGDGTA